ncbi:MAG TPA: malonic semialdehyde reductase [Rhodospirillaceae bacterium]|jgi:3-hydroxypropanoate dehydrogenase|nr:malonic semialdehyde reductase [Alphaproteobacteria bacterium]HBH27061.1 malonic semialdehyde reductase [Rhodospirillaceae bacterium]
MHEDTHDLLFRAARTHSAWTDRPVGEAEIQALYDLAKWGPTAANGCPGRFVFVASPEGKARLKPHLAPGNVDKTMAAPVTAIVAHDTAFFEALPRLFPYTDARAWYADSPDLAQETAFRNGTLQAAYLIMAARALGLDCGPMSGFDAAGVKQAFFADAPTVEPNVLINLGHGDASKLHPRAPRLTFDEACKIV